MKLRENRRCRSRSFSGAAIGNFTWSLKPRFSGEPVGKMADGQMGDAQRDVITTLFLLLPFRRANRRSRPEIFCHCRSRLARSAAAKRRYQRATLETVRSASNKRSCSSFGVAPLRAESRKNGRRAATRFPRSSVINFYCAAACLSLYPRARCNLFELGFLRTETIEHVALLHYYSGWKQLLNLLLFAFHVGSVDFKHNSFSVIDGCAHCSLIERNCTVETFIGLES